MLVVLTLIAAEFTWLTQPAQAAGWPPWRPAHVRLSARIIGHRLLITGSGFQNCRALAVRARLHDGDPWFSLDILHTSRRGKFSADLPLPHRLENANKLSVCVKDTNSSRLMCVTAHRY
jgi:hypothetical protein